MRLRDKGKGLGQRQRAKARDKGKELGQRQRAKARDKGKDSRQRARDKGKGKREGHMAGLVMIEKKSAVVYLCE